MKIAVDCFEIVDKATGAGRVIDNILKYLLDLLPEHEFFLFCREHIAGYSKNHVRQSVIPWEKGYLRWQNGPFWRGLKKVNPDLLIASNYMLPFFNRWESILIVHDISLIAHPEWYPKRVAMTRGFLLRRSLRKSNLIVVPSEFTKMEIIRLRAAEPDKIKLVSLGVEKSFKKCPLEGVLQWKKRKGLENKKIIGYLGSIFNRRNVPELIQATELLRKEFQDLALYLVGKDLSHPPQGIAKLLEKEWMRWQEFIAEEELPFFYSAIDAFAYLSEYEGFGLPPLEALACGALPVVLNTSSLQEIFKDLAIMVNSTEIEAIKEALKRAITEDRIKQEILNRFSQNRGKFSWQRVASEFSLLIKNMQKEKPI